MAATRSAALPKAFFALLSAYFAASLAHFAHNAEYIAVYPNLPGWITRDTVYLAWAAITAVGAAGLLVLKTRWPAIGLLLLGAYGAFGLDGLAHYTLALCSEHTLGTNVTIWAEAGTGLAMLIVSVLTACRRLDFPAWEHG